MLLTAITNLFGVVLFLFLYWRRLREDYIESHIFSSSFYILIGIVIGELISKYLAPTAWFWLALVGAFAGYAYGIRKFRLRAYEALEAVVLGLLVWLLLLLIIPSVFPFSLGNLAFFLLVVLLLVLFFVLDKHYKKFTWYQSGRVGFTGLSILGLNFLSRSGIALVFTNVISLHGKYDVYASGIIAFMSFLLLYNLSRKKS